MVEKSRYYLNDCRFRVDVVLIYLYLDRVKKSVYLVLKLIVYNEIF